MQATTNICNLDSIYTDRFKFSLPRTELEKQLTGKAFDHKEYYTAIWKSKDMSLEIQNSITYNKIKELHDQMAEKLERPDLFWEKTVESESSVV